MSILDTKTCAEQVFVFSNFWQYDKALESAIQVTEKRFPHAQKN